MNKPLAELIPLIARGIAPTTAVATSLISPLAQAASGDLDPAFADVGRLSQILGLEGAAWSVETLDDGGALVGGGDFDLQYSWYCYYYFYDCAIEASNFASSLTASGSIDPAFQAAGVPDVEVFDIARQADGKVVAAGRKVTGDRRHATDQLLVFRLASDGTLDVAFATEGLFELSTADFGPDHQAQALALDPDGGIVVAGLRKIVVDDTLVSALIVLRLQADGRLDASFGSGGIFIGPAVPYANAVRVARTAAGAYRVAATTETGCAVIGLTATGALDVAFGAAAIAPVESAPGESVYCQSLVAQDDGSILLAGHVAGHGFVTRLLASGARDPLFAADASLASSMNDATSIASAVDGKILVGGLGLKGASIMRLQATGQLDSLFGDDGRTWIDLSSDSGAVPVVHDIAVQADGSVIAAGGEAYADKAFVVRLLGDAGGDSPGVLSLTESFVAPFEADGQAVIHVRRSGGSAGDVDVEYRTVADTALEAADYAATSGTLHWADGDASEQEILIPISSDDGPPEGYEAFRITLHDVNGGAGLGTQNANIDIQPDGAPAGQIALDYVPDTVLENGIAQFWVSRNFYSDGEVSVTITPEGVTAAAGTDFDPQPVTITWAAGELGAKLVEIALPDDTEQEGRETFQVELANPTGGAILGPTTSAQLAIAANDAHSSRRPVGGGGSAGFLSLLLLGLAELIRSARRSLHRGA